MIKRIALAAAIGALVLTLVPVAFAAKGGGGGPGKPGGGGTGTGGGTLSLVLLNSTDGLAHQGQHVTFTVATTATTSPYVKLNCYQNGAWVYTASVGFFASYPWPQQFTLASGWWMSGAADCTATLLYTNASGTSETSLASMSFHVSA